MLSRHEAGHEKQNQQDASAPAPRGPRKRRKVAFEHDATSPTGTEDPTAELGEQGRSEWQIWNPNLQQTTSLGLTSLSDVSDSSSYQFSHSTGSQPAIIQQIPTSIPQVPDSQRILYGNGEESGLPGYRSS